jgi:hypothetical protein
MFPVKISQAGMTENLLGIALAVLLSTCTGSSGQPTSKGEQGQEQEIGQEQQQEQQRESGFLRKLEAIQGQQLIEPATTSQFARASNQPPTTEEIPVLTIQDEDSEEDDKSISESPTVSIHDHQIWDQILKKYVSETGRVDYAGIKKDRSTLDKYLEQLRGNPVQEYWTKPQQLAYWINAYNAFTVDLIIRNYPLKTIIDLDKPWDQEFIQLGDKSYSLNEIEHEIVRPAFKDARVHFVFVCAAVSCPKLLNTAYLPQKLDQQLDAQTRFFLNTSGKNQLSTNLVKISKLFDWYGEDFTSQGTLIEFLNKYSKQEISAGAKVEFLEYDWTINH